MSIDWVASEYHYGRGVTVGAGGDSRTREWRITGTTPDVAKVDAGVPGRLDPHPADPSLLLDTIAFSPTGYGTLVRANYVPQAYTGSPPPENTQELEYISIDTTFESVDVDIPVFQLVNQRTILGPSLTPIQIPVYIPVARAATFRYAKTVHRIRLNATVGSGQDVSGQLNLTNVIAQQTNKIHQISGRRYLFVCDSISRLEIDKYAFTYRWIQDPGIPNTLSFDEVITPDAASSAGAGLGRIGTYVYPLAQAPEGQGSGQIIKPYERIDVMPAQIGGTEDPSLPPVVRSSPLYEEDFSGFLTLPGAV